MSSTRPAPSCSTFPDPQASDGNPGTGGAAVDPTNGNVVISGQISPAVAEYDSSGNLLGTLNTDNNGNMQVAGTPGIDSNGYLYLPQYSDRVDIFTPNAVVPAVTYKPPTSPTTNSATVNANVDPNGGGDITACHFEYGARRLLRHQRHLRARPEWRPLLLADRRQRGDLRPLGRHDLPLPGRCRQRQRHQVRLRSDLHDGQGGRAQHRPRNERNRLGRDAQRLLRRRRHRHHLLLRVGVDDRLWQSDRSAARR